MVSTGNKALQMWFPSLMDIGGVASEGADKENDPMAAKRRLERDVSVESEVSQPDSSSSSLGLGSLRKMSFMDRLLGKSKKNLA